MSKIEVNGWNGIWQLERINGGLTQVKSLHEVLT